MKHIFNKDFIDFLQVLNSSEVRYLLVGGYAVVVHGYHRMTGDLDVWVEQTQENYRRLMVAMKDFGIPESAITQLDFLGNTGMDVFTFGRPPVAIDILTRVKGVEFDNAYQLSQVIAIQGIEVRVVSVETLIESKFASGRYKDLDDIDHLRRK